MGNPVVRQRHRNTCLVDMIFGSHFYDFLTKILVFAFAWGVFMGIWAIIMKNHVESGQVQVVQLFSFNYKMRFNGSLDTATDLAVVDQYKELAHLLFMRCGSKSKNDAEKKTIPEETTPTPDVKYRNLRQLVKKRQKIRAGNEDKKEAEICKAGVTHKEASSDDGNKTTGVVNGKTGTVKLANFGFAVYKEPSNVTAIKSWCRQHFHNRTSMIIHRDVKGDSILIDGVSGKIKLADFCVAVPYEGSVHNVAGTLAYLSAEDLEGEQNEKSDIYSFGMCVLQMMTKEAVYSEYRSEYELFAKIKLGVKPVALYLVQDRMVRKFIEKCLAKASKRPTVSALLKHPFNEKVQSCTFPDAMKLLYDLQLRQFIERCVKPLYERPAASEFLKHPCLSTNDEGGVEAKTTGQIQAGWGP